MIQRYCYSISAYSSSATQWLDIVSCSRSFIHHEFVAPAMWMNVISGADSMEHGGTCLKPLLQMAGHWGTVSRKTANNKLTKVYWPSWKRSSNQLIVLLEPKKWRGTAKKKFPALCAGPVPTTFKFVPTPLNVIDMWCPNYCLQIIPKYRRNCTTLALNDRPESETVIPASCVRSLALYVMYLTSPDIAVSLWHISAISIASPSLIATPHTHDAPGKLVQSQCLTCTCNVIHRFRSPNGFIHIYKSGEEGSVNANAKLRMFTGHSTRK